MVDVAVLKPKYSKRSLSVKLGGAGTERFFRHHEARDHGRQPMLVRMWTTDTQRQNSRLAVCSGEAAEMRENKRLDQNKSRAVAKPIGEAQHYGIAQYSTRTDAELTESTGESGTNTTAATTVTCVQDSARRTGEPRDRRAVAMQPQGSRSQR